MTHSIDTIHSYGKNIRTLITYIFFRLPYSFRPPVIFNSQYMFGMPFYSVLDWYAVLANKNRTWLLFSIINLFFIYFWQEENSLFWNNSFWLIILDISLGVMVFNPAINDIGFLCSREILEVVKCECLLICLSFILKRAFLILKCQL